MSFIALSDVALTLIALALAGSFGLLLGRVKIARVGLGIGGVLFSGLAVGHVAADWGIAFDADMLHFVREFGLILFVYTIGIQVGPSFFKSFGRDGLRLNLAAIAIVALGVAVTVAVFLLFGLDLAALVGVMSGAVTNTPGLGAATQILAETGFGDDALALTGLGYAVAYPFGIVGILLTMLALRALLRIDVSREAADWARETGAGAAALPTVDVVVTNPNLDGVALGEVPGLFDGEVVASRMMQGGEIAVPTRAARLHVGDSLHIVGPARALAAMKLLLGPEAAKPISTKGTRMSWARLVVTERKALGVRLRDLALLEGHQVTISRINRAGIELPPRADSKLAFGDIVTVVGLPDDIEAVKMRLGDERARLDQVQFEALFVGIALGILLGSVPLALPGLPAPLKLGLAGGPLVAAILLGRLGHWGPFVWFMPPVANTALREIGIVLFLAVVGITAGDRFVETLLHGPGLSWMGYGVLITLVPLVVVGLLARLVFRFNYLSLAGVLAGSMTDPPALAFAASMHAAPAASVAYVSVYPLVMFLRILAPQLMVLLLLGAGG
ncbi:putative transporter [Sinisalibacter aestuarii]|uniref:Transport protein n=1 Tax=Sinisalibacter aestuarii TaxID=2949426 RepID=A0ABQ5M0I6_9RHOB|nr:putative transporter [Sinisalibacter aestuarii]GKY90206.1 putative transport protein [Sinisalibacter aestuarii]